MPTVFVCMDDSDEVKGLFTRESVAHAAAERMRWTVHEVPVDALDPLAWPMGMQPFQARIRIAPEPCVLHIGPSEDVPAGWGPLEREERLGLRRTQPRVLHLGMGGTFWARDRHDATRIVGEQLDAQVIAHAQQDPSVCGDDRIVDEGTRRLYCLEKRGHAGRHRMGQISWEVTGSAGRRALPAPR